MPKFRKKPVVIEAVQFVDNYSADEIMKWAGDVVDMDDYEPSDSQCYVLGVKTLEGYMLAQRGWWIIKGVKGEFYPCAPDIFEATYEAVDSGEEASPA